MDSFEHKNSDFVFLVNESPLRNKNGHRMIDSKKKIRDMLRRIIMDVETNGETKNPDENNIYPLISCVEPEDRIALVKFSRNVKRVFSLVEKKTNFTQLEN